MSWLQRIFIPHFGHFHQTDPMKALLKAFDIQITIDIFVFCKYYFQYELKIKLLNSY